MALSALSLAQHTGGNSTDALEHYQQVIPALKATVQSSQDSYSDGALFTHFILLLYEVSLVRLINLNLLSESTSTSQILMQAVSPIALF